jgi:hypothetical protein
MIPLNKYTDFCKTNGVSLLEVYGGEDYALTRTYALQAVTILRELGVGIVGGSVLFITRDKIRYPGTENWSVEEQWKFGDKIGIENSLILAEKYVSNYKYTPEGEIAIFNLTLDSRINIVRQLENKKEA